MVLVDRPERYGWVSIILHWGLAATMLTSWAAGLLEEDSAAFELHVVAGLLALAFAILWLLWRLWAPRPAPLTRHPWEHRLARLVQAGLLLVAIGSGVSGLLALEGEDMPVPGASWFAAAGTWLDPVPAVRADGDAWDEEEMWEVEEDEGIFGELGEESHGFLAQLLFPLLLALHLAGVIKHHLLDGVPVLRRMLGQPVAAAPTAAPPG